MRTEDLTIWEEIEADWDARVVQLGRVYFARDMARRELALARSCADMMQHWQARAREHAERASLWGDIAIDVARANPPEEAA